MLPALTEVLPGRDHSETQLGRVYVVLYKDKNKCYRAAGRIGSVSQLFLLS